MRYENHNGWEVEAWLGLCQGGVSGLLCYPDRFMQFICSYYHTKVYAIFVFRTSCHTNCILLSHSSDQQSWRGLCAFILSRLYLFISANILATDSGNVFCSLSCLTFLWSKCLARLVIRCFYSCSICQYINILFTQFNILG